MARFDFCSGTFQSISPNINAEMAMNVYPEAASSPNARSAIALLSSEGTKTFASLPAGSSESVPGGLTYKGRTFVVGILIATQSMHLYELKIDGSLTDLTPAGIGAPLSTAPAIWAANPNQVAFTVAGTGFIYVLNLATNVVTSQQPNGELAASIAFMDAFFFTFISGTNTFMVSALEDATTWPSTNIASIEEFTDPIVAMKVLERTLWFIGQKQMVPYISTGALFPVAPVPGVLVEEGGAAAYGVEKLDNTLLWLGANVDEGTGMAWRLNGYTPQRISNHDVETIWQSYARIDDVISSKYQSRGHKIWQLYFPTAKATWRYDVSTQLWHQAGQWDSQHGDYSPHRSQWHTFNFGKHLVGDPLSGNIYEMSPDFATDDGTAIRRERRGPYIAKEHEIELHKKLEILAETGQASVADHSESPAYVYLKDSTGQVWQVGLNDAGIPLPQYAPANSPVSVPVLADSVNQSTFWIIAITPGGALYGIQTAFGRADIVILNLATQGSFLDGGLVVNQQGVVTNIAPQPHLRPAQLEICWSDDGAHTWSEWHTVSLGAQGDYRHRAILRRLGKSRNRVYRVVCNDPISLRIVDAFINDPKEAVERMSDQLRKMA